MGFLGFRHGTHGMPKNDWLGSSSTLSGALEKGCKRMMRKNLENGKCFTDAICYIPPCSVGRLARDEKRIGLRGSEGNRSCGEQGRKQRFIARIVTSLIFGSSPELNPTFRLLKIYYFPYIFVGNRHKMSKKNGKREREKKKKTEDMESNSCFSRLCQTK